MRFPRYRYACPALAAVGAMPAFGPTRPRQLPRRSAGKPRDSLRIEPDRRRRCRARSRGQHPAAPACQGFKAKVINGLAYAPSYAPIQVQRAIWAGNQIRHKPYIYGGGHGVWNASGYDCSGSVSYVLHAAGLIKLDGLERVR